MLKLFHLFTLFVLTSVARAQGVTVFLLDDVGRLDLDSVMASGYAPNLVAIAQNGFQFRKPTGSALCQPTRRPLDFRKCPAR